jgi:cytochrome d ubiquinol oxidase subunit I
VQGLLLTRDAVSPGTTVSEVLLSLIGFAVIYAILGAVMTCLFVRFIKAGPKPPHDADDAGDVDSDLLFAY